MLVLRVERKGASGATVREEEFGGAEGSRTPDPHNAIVVLYQLSYDPTQMSDLYEAGVRACQSQNPIILKALPPRLPWSSEASFDRLPRSGRGGWCRFHRPGFDDGIDQCGQGYGEEDTPEAPETSKDQNRNNHCDGMQTGSL